MVSLYSSAVMNYKLTMKAMSQLKWSWFSKPRKLRDLQRFDEGSRGPWGSLKLFATVHRPSVHLLSLRFVCSKLS